MALQILEYARCPATAEHRERTLSFGQSAQAIRTLLAACPRLLRQLPLLCRSSLQQSSVPAQVGGNFLRRDPGRSVGVLACAWRTDCGFFSVLRRGQNFLSAIGQAVDLARLAWPAVVFVKRGVDARQDGLERNPRVLPGLNQRPVQGGE